MVHPNKNSRKVRLALERLEERNVPSGYLTTDFGAGTWTNGARNGNGAVIDLRRENVAYDNGGVIIGQPAQWSGLSNDFNPPVEVDMHWTESSPPEFMTPREAGAFAAEYPGWELSAVGIPDGAGCHWRLAASEATAYIPNVTRYNEGHASHRDSK